MIIKKAKYKKLMVEQLRQVSEEVHGCDECRKEIKNFPNEPSRLELRVFHHDDRCDYLHFCSWGCVIKHLPKIKSDYFVDLPFLYFGNSKDDKLVGKRSAIELLKILSKLK